MTGTITLIGCSMTDEVFELDPKIFPDDDGIMWNITAIQRDADRGLFGPPIKRPLSVLPPLAAANTANIDWRKVLRFAAMPEVLAKPIICIEYNGARHIADGNCRISARLRAGLTDFDSYIVPLEAERYYRVVILADGKEIT